MIKREIQFSFGFTEESDEDFGDFHCNRYSIQLPLEKQKLT